MKSLYKMRLIEDLFNTSLFEYKNHHYNTQTTSKLQEEAIKKILIFNNPKKKIII